MKRTIHAESIIVGGGMAGLSAAIYLGRARRDTLVIDSGKSMARWEPDVQNYLGFPDGIAGQELIYRGRKQARRFGARFMKDQVLGGKRKNGCFTLDETVEYGLYSRKVSPPTPFVCTTNSNYATSQNGS